MAISRCFGRPVEQWRECFYNSNYDVSEYGRIRNKKTGKLIAPSVSLRGYASVSLYEHGMRRTFRIQRLVAHAFLGPPPTEQHHVAHINGNRSENHYTNLRWATPKENAQDKKFHGTHPSGQQNGRAILKEKDVLAIRTAHALGNVTYAALSRLYGVSADQIESIVKRKRWGHI
ncbi:MAG: HNH endonuclease [Nitrosomonas ureae]